MPLLTYFAAFAAVLLVAWHSGVGPAILTLILCVTGAVYWFIPPLHSFKIVEPSYGYSVLRLVLLRALVIAFCETHRRA
jgi:K+-sensing histidine kinase KdpD